MWFGGGVAVSFEGFKVSIFFDKVGLLIVGVFGFFESKLFVLVLFCDGCSHTLGWGDFHVVVPFCVVVVVVAAAIGALGRHLV